MMEYRRVIPNLREDETLYVFARSTLFAFLPWIGLTLGLLLIGIFIIFAFSRVGLTLTGDPMVSNILVVLASAFLLMIIAFFTVAFIDYYYDIHVVTDRRIIDVDRNGLFAQEISELLLEEVEDVSTVKNGILSNIFDFGHVIIQTSGEKREFEFDNVLHPIEINELILDLSSQAKLRIENGEPAVVVPRGRIKGVVNNTILHTWPELDDAGVVAQGSLAEQMVKAARTAIASSAGKEAPRTVPEAAPKATPPPIASAASRPVSPTPRSASESQPALTRPTPPASSGSNTQSNQPNNPKEGASDDLDIIIDDPNRAKG